MQRIDELLPLFRDLQPMAAPTPGKPDPHENLTDILEVVAVASGLRPAHLQGQGQHDDRRVAALEAIACGHGLSTLRTRSLIPYFHRARGYDARIIEFEDAHNVRNQ